MVESKIPVLANPTRDASRCRILSPSGPGPYAAVLIRNTLLATRVGSTVNASIIGAAYDYGKDNIYELRCRPTGKDTRSGLRFNMSFSCGESLGVIMNRSHWSARTWRVRQLLYKR